MDASRRMLARLLPLLVVPLAACGGSTATPTGNGASTGPGGSSNGQGGGSAGTSAGQGGASGTGVGGNAAQGGAVQGAGGGSGGVAGAGQGGNPIACANTPLLPDSNTGYFTCGSDAIHRTTPTACPDLLPMTDNGCNSANGPGGCSGAGSCMMSPYGYCAPDNGGGAFICGCHYGCVQDTDCGSGQICLCGTDIGSCVAATCTKDADCSGGALCLSYVVPSSCSSTTEFACTTPQDQCVSDDDCPAGGGPLQDVCSFDGKKRVCMMGPELCAGRPMIVEEVARVAKLVRGRSYSGWG